DEVERVTRDRPHIRPVLLGPTLSATLLQRAMRAGVRDVVTSQEELPEALLRVSERLQAAFPPPAAERQPSARGRMITVFSSKGGTGKSVVACNVATLMARRTDRPVALVDADLQFGDVAVMLHLIPQRTVVDAVTAIDRLDATLLRSLLILPMTKIKLVINRANSKVNLDLGDIEQTLGMKAACLIPSDVAVPRSVNNGTPVVLESPKSGVTRSLEHFADELVAAAHESP